MRFVCSSFCTIIIYLWLSPLIEPLPKRAIELNPNVSQIHFYYAMNYLSPMGRTDEAIRELKQTLELEQLSIVNRVNLAVVYSYARQNERALEQAKIAYDLEPNFVIGRIGLGYIYNANGMYVEAISLGEESLRIYPANQDFLMITGYAYAKSDHRREAEETVKKFKEVAKTQYVAPYYIAIIYGALGERDDAFAELEKAFAEHDWSLQLLKVDPYMDSLRDDPRFKDLLRRMGLPY